MKEFRMYTLDVLYNLVQHLTLKTLKTRLILFFFFFLSGLDTL